MRECIEEGILQAYVDNELSPEMAETVILHLSACSTCAEAANEAASETALLTNAFEAENALEIPTVRLRERLDTAIAELDRPPSLFEQKQGRNASGWLASFAGLFKISPARALGFASLIAVVAFAAIFAVVQLNRSEREDTKAPVIADSGRETKTGPGVKSRPSPTPSPDNSNREPDKDEKNAPNNRKKPKKQVNPDLVPEPNQLPKDELAAKPLPGEQNYLKAIDSLMTEIESSGETALKPSLRAEYERNLAIVDRAINSTRMAARRNPNDPDASEFLYSSYQSKLDLLNAIAEQVRPVIATR
jgi:Putative zinc-finger